MAMRRQKSFPALRVLASWFNLRNPIRFGSTNALIWLLFLGCLVKIIMSKAVLDVVLGPADQRTPLNREINKTI